MENENRGNKRSEPTYSIRVKAGRRRTYFLDVRPTREEFYITITESKKRNDDSYEKHKIFIYKEDFNKFLAGLTDTINHIKTELMPGADFEQYDRKEYTENREHNNNTDHSFSNNMDTNNSMDSIEEKQEDNTTESHDTNPPASAPSSMPTHPSADEDLKW